MKEDLFDFDPDRQLDLEEREERCQKALKVVSKAIVMRLFVSGLLIFAVLRSPIQLWAAGLMLLVLIINLMGMLPLIAEWKKRRQEWKQLLEEE